MYAYNHLTGIATRLETLRLMEIRHPQANSTVSSRSHGPSVLASSEKKAAGRRQILFYKSSSKKRCLKMTTPSKKQAVSLCMIVCNEEGNLPVCLRPMRGVVDEIVIADTGSVDRTKSIAAAFGAKIFDLPWCDSFSAARNESIRHATGDWILWLDADEFFDVENLEKLKRLLAELGSDNTAYFMKQISQHRSASGAETVVDQVRLFRNHPDHRWTYHVHEQIQPALEASGTQFRSTPIAIQHRGYTDDNLAIRKLERNLRLAQLDLAENPDDAFVLFNLGSIYCGLNRPVEALPLLRCSLELTGPDFTISHQTYALVSRCHLELGQFEEALRWCLKGRNAFAHDVGLVHMEADLRLATNDLAGAKACLAEYLKEFAPRSISIDGATGGATLRSEDCASRLA
jgi:glycosyltransferase involved in cell wall biosynthesis